MTRTHADALAVQAQAFEADHAFYLSLQDLEDSLEAQTDYQAERDAENAWLRHAESAGWQETALEERIENERGVISFGAAFRAACPYAWC